jgi:epsilon-lactone hydrolase
MTPELARAYQMWRTLLPQGEHSIPEIRRIVEDFYRQFSIAPDVLIEPVNANGVRALSITSSAGHECDIIYFHGGGYICGSAQAYSEMTSRLARACHARVLTVDYRLAPEHPFPAAVDDALAAYHWLTSEAADNLLVCGDSAGGGLTLATLISLRDAGERLPAAAVCISPWVDLEMTQASMDSLAAVDPLINRDILTGMATIHLNGHDPRSPLAAPLHADLRGLPPLLVQVGTWETMLDEARCIADRARQAGVQVKLETWEQMIHVWHVFPFLPQAQRALESISAFVREHIRPRAVGAAD